MAIEKVSALVLDRLAVFEFGVICEVFGIDRSADGVPNFDFKVCGPEPGKPMRTSVGAALTPDHGLDDLDRRRPRRDPGDRRIRLPARGAEGGASRLDACCIEPEGSPASVVAIAARAGAIGRGHRPGTVCSWTDQPSAASPWQVRRA